MSRSSLVAMLIAVEIAIVGIALYTVRGTWAGTSIAAGFAAKTFAPLDAGLRAGRRRSTIRDSRVDVAVSTDGLVHVKDLTDLHGRSSVRSSSVAQLDVKRTAGGVSISRPDSGRRATVDFR